MRADFVQPVGCELEQLCGASDAGNQSDELRMLFPSNLCRLRDADIKLHGVDTRLRVAQLFVLVICAKKIEKQHLSPECMRRRDMPDAFSTGLPNHRTCYFFLFTISCPCSLRS